LEHTTRTANDADAGPAPQRSEDRPARNQQASAEGAPRDVRTEGPKERKRPEQDGPQAREAEGRELDPSVKLGGYHPRPCAPD